jgi:uncharacterized membrane protein YhhN
MLQYITLFIAIALTVGALAAWVMALRTPDTSSQSNRIGYLLAPLAVAWLVALLPPAGDHLFYKGAVVLGILLALIGVALYISGFLPNYVAHAHLLLTYTLYAYAFASQTSGWPSPFSLILVVAAALIYYWLYPTLAELWESIALYALLIFLATWQAFELALQQPTSLMGWAALVGMLLVAAAALLEAQARFRRFRPNWATASLPVFLLAQLAIAWSVWG